MAADLTIVTFPDTVVVMPTKRAALSFIQQLHRGGALGHSVAAITSEEIHRVAQDAVRAGLTVVIRHG